MSNHRNFYIDGKWIKPSTSGALDVINPATEEAFTAISMGGAADVDKAVASAKSTFSTWGFTDPADRITLIEKLVDIYERRNDEMAQAISSEMGAPISMAKTDQAVAGSYHLRGFLKALETFPWEHSLRSDSPGEHIVHEPIGVVGLITPWNWPMNQVALKVGAALAAGCTMVLKPSEIAPVSSMLFAEFMDEAGCPSGAFNLVNGDGPTVGEAMSTHPDIDAMSLTGSARAGIAVTKSSADTIKRVLLELGGKGANIVFADSDPNKSVKRGARSCFHNTGQSCNAPTRMLVEHSIYDRAVEIATKIAESTSVGDPATEGRHIGPLSSQAQFDKVQSLIQAGIDEGARLVAGGPGRPEGFNRGYYTRPTVFADVDNSMTVAREEIFGPVLSMIPFKDEAEAIEIANDTPYGLTAYVQSGDQQRAENVARRLRSGMVQMNGASRPMGSPFGGYKQSGIGREGGYWGILDFLEVKAISGWSSNG